MESLLKKYRRERGITQKQLANNIGVEPQYISNLESGYRDISKVSFGTVISICDALHINDPRLLIPMNGEHRRRKITDSKREYFRRISAQSRQAKKEAMAGKGPKPLFPINHPIFDPDSLMPQRARADVPTISLFSGGGGLDLGFDRAGAKNIGSWEILDDAANTLKTNRPKWNIHGGMDGDVRGIDWRQYKGNAAIVQGGPPCQPFSIAGRQKGALDPRDMWPEFTRCVLECRPIIFVAENVAALAMPRFKDYVREVIYKPLEHFYTIRMIRMQAYDYGVPQSRNRILFFGFNTEKLAKAWHKPKPTHRLAGTFDNGLPVTIGVRKALGLPDIGYDNICPTLRSGLSGPRHTTSILNSVTSAKKYEKLGLWPNGVASDRKSAHLFVTKNKTFRLSVPDVQLIQGFPESWKFVGATYMRLGQIGNSVCPPVAYNAAVSVLDLLR